VRGPRHLLQPAELPVRQRAFRFRPVTVPLPAVPAWVPVRPRLHLLRIKILKKSCDTATHVYSHRLDLCFDRLSKELLVTSHNLLGRSISQKYPIMEQHDALTQLPNRIHIVRNKYNGHASLAELVKARGTLPLKRSVAHGQDFIDQKDVRIDLRRNRKTQAHVHPRRILLNWGIDKLAELGKSHNALFARLDFSAG